MLSTLPKLADKAFIVGFILPVLLFALALLALFADIEAVKQILPAIAEQNRLETAFYFVLAIWTFSILMLITNRILFQLLEGYRWPFSKVNCLKQREQHRFKTLRGPVIALLKERKKNQGQLPKAKEDELTECWIRLKANFADDENLILPTKFGNAILAFEQYPSAVYGADGVTLWFHLTSVMPASFQAIIVDARAQVNCLMNICFFAAVIGCAGFARLVWLLVQTVDFGMNGAIAQKLFYFAAAAIVGFAVMRLTYNLSIERIYTWGDLVKAAFDCYLPALANKLGYQLPSSGAEQQQFWIAISQRAAYHSRLSPERWVQISPEKPEKENGEKGGRKLDECNSTPESDNGEVETDGEAR